MIPFLGIQWSLLAFIDICTHRSRYLFNKNTHFLFKLQRKRKWMMTSTECQLGFNPSLQIYPKTHTHAQVQTFVMFILGWQLDDIWNQKMQAAGYTSKWIFLIISFEVGTPLLNSNLYRWEEPHLIWGKPSDSMIYKGHGRRNDFALYLPGFTFAEKFIHWLQHTSLGFW